MWWQSGDDRVVVINRVSNTNNNENKNYKTI